MSTILLVVQDFATIHGIETNGFYNPLLQEKCKYRMIISYVYISMVGYIWYIYINKCWATNWQLVWELYYPISWGKSQSISWEVRSWQANIFRDDRGFWTLKHVEKTWKQRETSEKNHRTLIKPTTERQVGEGLDTLEIEGGPEEVGDDEFLPSLRASLWRSTRWNSA